MPPQFKDFHKDVKDVLTKNVQEAKWSLESKYKGPDSTVYVNPNYNTKDGKGLTVNVEYNVKQYGLKTKATVKEDLSVVPRVTMEQTWGKIEAMVDKNLNFELSDEYAATNYIVNAKATNTTRELGVAVVVHPLVTLGGEVVETGGALASWSTGLSTKSRTWGASLTMHALKSYTFGVKSIVPGVDGVTAAAQVTTGPGLPVSGAVGVEANPLYGLTLKGRINTAGVITVTAIKSFADKWKAAVTLDSATNKFGLLLSRE